MLQGEGMTDSRICSVFFFVFGRIKGEPYAHLSRNLQASKYIKVAVENKFTT